MKGFGESEEGPDDARVIEVGGVRYVMPTDRTFECDLWTEAEVARAGLGNLTVEDGETALDFARRVNDTGLRSGRLLPLLGAMMFPEGLAVEDWTPAVAEATAAHLASVRDAQGKAAIRGILAGVLLRFFEAGSASAKTSATSSGSFAGPLPASEDGPQGGSSDDLLLNALSPASAVH